MLGEKIIEERGRVTGRRVLPSTGACPTVETSFEASGTVLGVSHNNIGTYRAVARPDGTLFGEGQGVVMGESGEMAQWAGQGVGRFTSAGGISFRGAIYFQTMSPAWSRLNGMAVVFEHEVDRQGELHDQLWEWK